MSISAKVRRMSYRRQKIVLKREIPRRVEDTLQKLGLPYSELFREKLLFMSNLIFQPTRRKNLRPKVGIEYVRLTDRMWIRSLQNPLPGRLYRPGKS